MEKFTIVTGVAAPMLQSDINTDLIAPALVRGRKPEEMVNVPLKDKMFANLRYDMEGKERADFVLNQARYRHSAILLGGPNFGCGSSRETAVWALMEFGFRCVIAPSFGDIFRDNAFQNGLLPLQIGMEEIQRIADALAKSNNGEMTVNLEARRIEVPGMAPIPFNLAEDRRVPLMAGIEELDFILLSADDITAYEKRDAAANAWRYQE
jgi:3-isopropylmalate/(R)-2-methylmalate dehydratase small subunit